MLIYYGAIDMMDDIVALLSCKSSSDECATMASKIIAQYELPFSVADVTTIIEYSLQISNRHYVANFIHLSLTTNLRLFIAVMYAILDNKIVYNNWMRVVFRHNAQNGFELGAGSTYVAKQVSEVYCKLYDYCEFDITNLVLTDDVRNSIQKHINGKGSYTKRAAKQP